MFKGISQLAAILKSAQQVGAKMSQLNDLLKTKRAVGSSGGGLVEIELNGLLEVVRCSIAPDLVEKKDRELMEDLVSAAVNQAIAKGRQLHVEAMREVAGDIDIPGVQEAIARFAGMGGEAGDSGNSGK